MRASTQLPVSRRRANIRSCPLVLPVSARTALRQASFESMIATSSSTNESKRSAKFAKTCLLHTAERCHGQEAFSANSQTWKFRFRRRERRRFPTDRRFEDPSNERAGSLFLLSQILKLKFLLWTWAYSKVSIARNGDSVGKFAYSINCDLDQIVNLQSEVSAGNNPRPRHQKNPGRKTCLSKKIVHQLLKLTLHFRNGSRSRKDRNAVSLDTYSNPRAGINGSIGDVKTGSQACAIVKSLGLRKVQWIFPLDTSGRNVIANRIADDFTRSGGKEGKFRRTRPKSNPRIRKLCRARPLDSAWP